MKEEVVIYGQKYRERKQTVVLISDAGFVIVREAKNPFFLHEGFKLLLEDAPNIRNS